MESATELPPTFLLLLPPPPSPPTVAALKTAYGDTLSQVLREVASASQESSQAAVLDVALACPHLVRFQSQPRSSLYASTQSVLAAVYKLICIIATKDGINIEDSDGVDARVFPIAWSSDVSENDCGCASSYGPVVTLARFAASQRQWQYAFGVETDDGEAFVRAFVAAKQHAAHSHSHPTPSGETSTAGTAQFKTHYHVAVGGTFDHIHLGHKLLLTMTAFALDQRSGGDHVLTVGITGDELLKNKRYAAQLESWDARQASVHRFLDSLLDFASPESAEQPTMQAVDNPGPNGHAVNVKYASGLTVRCVEIEDPFGPTITDQAISALVVSGETRSGGKAVNDKRAEKGWSSLQVFEVDVLDAEEGNGAEESSEAYQSKISSTEIRRKLAEKTSRI
ncbi:hypothetical protein MBLNU459_g4069t1 [Dothideomycetes sp. NU459]